MLKAGETVASGDRRLAVWARTGLRLILGYLLAVATGAVLFVATVHVVGGTEYQPDSTGLGLAPDLLMNALFYFVTGALFGLPYTVAGTLAFVLWLPKSKTLFLLLGMLCPAAAAFLTMAAVGFLQVVNTAFLSFVLLTFPAGLAAAYIFGVIGMGWGFRRWRFA